jgi:signal peptidase I
MEPVIREGDWLLVDPTTDRWPRRGSIVAFLEPDGGALSIKRIAGGPGDRVPFRDGYLELADDEAWLLADATPEETAAAGYGEPIDSRSYGPVPVALLVGRVWFRYAPLRRIGRPDHRVVAERDPRG